MTSWEELVFWGTDGSVNLNWWLVLSTKVSVAIISWNWINIWGTFYSPCWSCAIALQKSLTSFILYFALCRAQLCGLSLEMSKVGDMSWSHLKQKRPSLLLSGVLQPFHCRKEQLPSLAVTVTLDNSIHSWLLWGAFVLPMWMSGSLDWIPQGFRHRHMHFHTATQKQICLWQRDQTWGLMGTLGKFKPNQEVLNQAGVGFECQCLTAALPAHKGWLHKAEQTHLHFRRGKKPFLWEPWAKQNVRTASSSEKSIRYGIYTQKSRSKFKCKCWP